MLNRIVQNILHRVSKLTSKSVMHETNMNENAHIYIYQNPVLIDIYS